VRAASVPQAAFCKAQCTREELTKIKRQLEALRESFG
jgi:hypothetical protein